MDAVKYLIHVSLRDMEYYDVVDDDELLNLIGNKQIDVTVVGSNLDAQTKQKKQVSYGV